DSPLAPRRGATDWHGTSGGNRTRNPYPAFPEATAGVASARISDIAETPRKRGSPRIFCARSRAVRRLGSERCEGILPAPPRPQKAAAGRVQGRHLKAGALALTARP